MKQEIAVETTMAYQELKKLKPGEMCPYSTLAAVIDKNPQTDGRGYVRTARGMVERELQCVLVAISNEGIKRLAPREVINHGGKDLKHIRKSVARGTRRQITIVPVEQAKELSNEERIKFNLQLSQFGILRQVMKPATAKKIEAAVIESSKALPADATIRLFLNKPEKRTSGR